MGKRSRLFGPRRESVGFLFVLPAVAYFAFVYIYPLVSSFIMSLQRFSPGRPPRFVGLDNYARVLSDPVFLVSAKNTIAFAVSSVPLTVICALVIAIALNAIRNLRWRNLFTTVYFLPLISSLVAASIVWEWLYHPVYGFINYLLQNIGLPPQQWLASPSQSLPSLVIVNLWLRLGFAVIILLASLQGLPAELYEAAELDGANGWKKFRHITLPLLNPQIVLVTMIEFIFATKVFDLVYATTQGGPVDSTRVVILYMYEMAFGRFRFGEASAVSVLVFLFLLAISVMQWRLMRRSSVS